LNEYFLSINSIEFRIIQQEHVYQRTNPINYIVYQE